MAHVLTDENFASDVLEAQGVVMVDFWAPWCGPCKALGPAIDELAGEYAGKALIGKYNTDEDMEYAQEFGIMSIPCVKFWKNGAYAGEIVGLRPKEAYEDMLDKLLES